MPETGLSPQGWPAGPHWPGTAPMVALEVWIQLSSQKAGWAGVSVPSSPPAAAPHFHPCLLRASHLQSYCLLRRMLDPIPFAFLTFKIPPLDLGKIRQGGQMTRSCCVALSSSPVTWSTYVNCQVLLESHPRDGKGCGQRFCHLFPRPSLAVITPHIWHRLRCRMGAGFGWLWSMQA